MDSTHNISSKSNKFQEYTVIFQTTQTDLLKGQTEEKLNFDG